MTKMELAPDTRDKIILLLEKKIERLEQKIEIYERKYENKKTSKVIQLIRIPE